MLRFQWRPFTALVASVAAAVLAAGALAGPAPRVDASAVVVGNGATGLILHGERQASRQAIASITKIMTALVVMERSTPNEIVRVAGPAPTIGEATIGLRAGERLTVRELLTAMLVESANDAAFALAYHVGDGSISRFVSLMNAKARALGLTETRFARPDGLDAAGHYSSARDVFKLARVAMRKPQFRELVRIRRATVAGRRIVNRNDLLSSYPGTFGVKTGHTTGAGWSQVAAARRDGLTIYAVLLGGATREGRNGDLMRLLDWGFDQYRRVAVVSAGETYARAAVPFSDRRLALVADESVLALAQLGRPLVERVVAPAMVALPVEKGETLGELRVFAGKKLLAIRPLTAAESIEEPSFGLRLRWYAGRALDHAGDALSSLFGFIV